MTKLKMITKGLLGASAISLFAATNAYAAGTAAGTPVLNTFTLDYQVSGTDQPTIDNTGTPTEFTVDRLIDLTVASNGDTDVAPGALNQELVFTVTNNGNDTQAYDFTVVSEGGDDFDASPLTIHYVVDNGAGGVCDATDLSGVALYTPGDASNDLAADGVICIIVRGNIDASQVDEDESEVSLVADTLYSTLAGGGLPGTEVLADAGTNTLTGDAENVLADGSGTGNEVVLAGDHSATGTYIVASPDLTAAKTVSIFTQDGTSCGTFPGTPGGGDQYSIPGACVEYVITAVNAGDTVSATGITITDVLPDSLIFIDAITAGFSGGTFAEPATSESCDGTATTCEIELDGATLTAGTTGTITIRALIK